ncbi:MAG: hypothetical protein ACRDSM_08815 [Pseudonocardiaceae bacterium]
MSHHDVSTQAVRPTTVTPAAGADVLAVLVFAAVGRSSHAEVVDAIGVLGSSSDGWLPGCGARLHGCGWRAVAHLVARSRDHST